MIWRFVSYAVLLWCCVHRPTRMSCLDKWMHDGVRTDGSFVCRPVPIGDPDYDGTWQRPDRSTQPPGEIRARIYCSGACPIVIDGRTVGCQRVTPCRMTI